MKNTLYSIGFTLVVGCNAALENPIHPSLANSAAGTNITSFKISNEDSLRYHNAVKNFFETKLNERNFNGSILVAKEGEVIYEQYTGFKNPLLQAEPLTAESAMHIASISKTFTATAILQLIQQGKLRLDQPISDFFPNFPYPGITIQMLLSHRSGLPNYTHFMEKIGWDKNVFATNQDVVNALYQSHPNPEAAPGTRFRYSNTNFLLLGQILEKVTGIPYPIYMKQNFFDPLQMNNTYVFTLQDTATAIPSYEANKRFWDWDFLDGTYGDKNIYTTPRDLLKWATAISSGQVIRFSLLDSAFTPYSNETKSVHNYGLGWRLLILPNGKKVIYHNGRWHGTNASFALLPDEKVTVIIIGNKFNTNIYNVARQSFDIFGNYMQGGPQADEEGDLTFQKPIHRSVAKRTYHHKHHKYSGRYVASTYRKRK